MGQECGPPENAALLTHLALTRCGGASDESGMEGLEDPKRESEGPGHSSPSRVCSVQGWESSMGFSCGPCRGMVKAACQGVCVVVGGGILFLQASVPKPQMDHLLPCPRGTADVSASESDSWGPNLILECFCKK